MIAFPDALAGMHPLAATTAERFLMAVDAELPGLVTGLHVVGSAALDDFVPGRCDLDFVAVTGWRPDADALDRLADMHAAMASTDGAVLDGTYVAAADWPGPGVEAPAVRAGRFEARSRYRDRPVDSLALAEHALTLRGPPPGWWDVPGVDGWAAEALRSLRPSADAAEVDEFVLHACRLHYMLALRRIASKSEAGLYGLISFKERWRRIVDEALRLRRSPDAPGLYADAEERRREALAFVREVARDGLSLT